METNTNKDRTLQQNSNHHNKNEESSLEVERSSQTYSQSSITTSTNNNNTKGSSNLIDNNIIIYDVEHLATFSTSSNQGTNINSRSTNDEVDDDDVIIDGIPVDEIEKREPIINSSQLSKATTPRAALQRLFELEKLSGIWTQHMQIELRDGLMLIIDCETNSVVERFNKECVLRPEAFSHYNDIYNNIVVFTIKSSRSQEVRLTNNEENINIRKEKGRERQEEVKESLRESDNKYAELDSPSSLYSAAEAVVEGELHIFQCVSHKAQQLVSDILSWKSDSTETNETIKQSTSSHSSGEKMFSDNRRFSVMSETRAAAATTTTGTINSDEEKKGRQDRSHTSSSSNSASLTQPANIPSKPVVVTVASSASASENVPLVNVNVKETVQVFNQIAALREKSKPSSPTNHTRPISDTSASSSQSLSTPASSSNTSNSSFSNSDPARLPLSSGGKLYKQRSIRATLAPNCAASQQSEKAKGGGGSTPNGAIVTQTSNLASEQQQQPGKQQSSTNRANFVTNSTASSASSSELMDKPNQNHSSLNQSAGMMRHTEGSGTQESRDALERLKEQTQEQESLAIGLNQQPQLSTSNYKISKSQAHQQQQLLASSDLSSSHASSSSRSHLDQVSTNESYVSVLNHCFDDIEKFIIRLQQAMTATHELQVKRKVSKRANQLANANSAMINSKSGSGNSPLTASELALLSAKARGPNDDDYFEILSKFKLAFNLLAKLKGCIHEPNAPELVHFLFTPLAIIIEAARNATPPVDPTLVGIPYLNQDALDLLSNCCTSKESDMWISLGPNWTQTIDMTLFKASRLPSSFQPIFSDGWAPIIGELELIGLVAPPSANASASATSNQNIRNQSEVTHIRDQPSYPLDESGGYTKVPPPIADSFPPNEQLDYNKNNGDLGLKTHAIGSRDYKKKISSSHATLDASGHQLDLLDPPLHRSAFINHHQMNSIPFGYSNPEMLDQPPEMHSSFLDHNSPSRKPCTSSENKPSRRAKQSSRQPKYIIPTPNYADSSYYPSKVMPHQRIADDNSHLDQIDLIAHQDTTSRGLHSDDYSELQDHYVSERGLPKMSRPGTSHHSRNNEQFLNNGNNLTNGLNLKQRYKNYSRSYGNGNNNKQASYYNQPSTLPPFESDYMNESDQEAMLLDLGSNQTEWFYELQARGATIVRVLFTREANNDKELSVQRGEVLEILDDTRKWWRARNIDQQVAHVPHTIVAIMQGYQTLDELLTNNPETIGCEEPSLITTSHQRYSRQGSQPLSYDQQQWNAYESDKRNSRSSGAFRYF